MSDSFLEEDQLSRANIKSGRRENLASSSSLDSLRVKWTVTSKEDVQIYSAGEKNHARNKHRETWILSTAKFETIKICKNIS